MRVVIINETFSPEMGYLGSMLPKFLARQGIETQVLATDLAPYHGLDEFKNGVPDFLAAQARSAGTVLDCDGYKVHILSHGRALGHVFMRGMYRVLRQIRPDVVYSVLAIGWIPLEAALLRTILGYRFFCGSHTSALTFASATVRNGKLGSRISEAAKRWIPGRIVSLLSERCYCPTADCGTIATTYFGIQEHKLSIVHLGVDTELFSPICSFKEQEDREKLRASLGFSADEIVCIYTGKMTESKNALLLALAIERLRAEGRRFRGLFIGDGSQRREIARFSNCVLMDFMPFSKLPAFYRASDIAVWPTNESTSMLDAAACGIPIVVSDRIYQDHVQGNGLPYRLNDLESLCAQLRVLEDAAVRRAMGQAGASKMRERFSWECAAVRRAVDFGAASPSGPHIPVGT
jgi:glycosyltransferase involved in cell wall biosynthesis